MFPMQEQRKLEQLHKDAELIMLMRARAFVILQWRGYRLPTADDMEKQLEQGDTNDRENFNRP